MTMSIENPSQAPLNIWVITEGIAGTENQCIGVAERMADLMPASHKVMRVTLKQPWQTLSPYIGGGGAHIYAAGSDVPTAPWPDLVIASGRKAIAPALYIKKQSQGRTLVVQLQDPRWAAGKFDLVAVPFHDLYRGQNAFVTHATPNRICAAKLRSEAALWSLPQGWAEAKPKGRIAVLIGGKSKAYDFTDETAQNLITMIKNFAAADYQVMVTASRRTGADNYKMLSDGLSGQDHIYFWDGQGHNPYFAFLAAADHIIVTPDSASMLSEAASTGKAVYVLDLPGGNAKFARFHDHMVEIGAVQKMDAQNAALGFTPRMVLNDAALIAEKIRELIADKCA